MSRPSISIPPLPPNRFFTGAILLLTLSTSTIATPFPVPMAGPHGVSSAHGSEHSNSTSSALSKSQPLPPLTSKQIAAIVCGVVFGVVLVAIVSYTMMHLNSVKGLITSRGKKTKNVEETVVVEQGRKEVEWDGMTNVELNETEEKKPYAYVSVQEVSSDAVSEVTTVPENHANGKP